VAPNWHRDSGPSSRRGSNVDARIAIPANLGLAKTTASTQQVVAAAADLRRTAEELDELCGHFAL
jgi:hypothetical protein